MAKAIAKLLLAISGLFLASVALQDAPLASALERISDRSAEAGSEALTLAEYSQLSGDEKHFRAWQEIKALVEYYRSAYDKDGNQKSQEEWLRHAKAARFIEDLFLPLDPETGEREFGKEKMATLLLLIEKIAEIDPDQTLDAAVLFFIRQEYKNRPDTSQTPSEPTADPAAGRDDGGIPFDAVPKADDVDAKTASNCFDIGTDPPPGKESDFYIPRQTVCPFVRMPDEREPEE